MRFCKISTANKTGKLKSYPVMNLRVPEHSIGQTSVKDILIHCVTIKLK